MTVDFLYVAGEIDIYVGKFLCSLDGINTFKFYQSGCVGFEVIFLNEERHHDIIQFQDKILGVCAVKDVIFNLHRNLAFDAMRLT